MRTSFVQPAIINTDIKKAPAKTGAFTINTHKPFRKTILPVTPLDGRFYKHQNRMSLNQRILAMGYPPGGEGVVATQATAKQQQRRSPHVRRSTARTSP